MKLYTRRFTEKELLLLRMVVESSLREEADEELQEIYDESLNFNEKKYISTKDALIRKFILLLIASEFMAFESYPFEVENSVLDKILEHIDDYYMEALYSAKGKMTFDELDEMVKRIENEIL